MNHIFGARRRRGTLKAKASFIHNDSLITTRGPPSLCLKSIFSHTCARDIKHFRHLRDSARTCVTHTSYARRGNYVRGCAVQMHMYAHTLQAASIFISWRRVSQGKSLIKFPPGWNFYKCKVMTFHDKTPTKPHKSVSRFCKVKKGVSSGKCPKCTYMYLLHHLKKASLNFEPHFIISCQSCKFV